MRAPAVRRKIVRIRPNTDTRIGSPVSVPSVTGVPAPRTTKPAFTKPINAMKKPIPTAIARLSSVGIARITASRRFVWVRTRTIRPSSTTTPIASGKVRPSPATSVKATKALRPRPLATANALLVTRPIRIVITPATSAVAVRVAPGLRPLAWRSGIPTKPRMTGFTKSMYAITMNVVRPAVISVRTFVLCALRLKSRSSSPPRAGAGPRSAVAR